MQKFRPRLETFESRLAPAAATWDYSGAGLGNTSIGANWVGGAVPGANDSISIPVGTGSMNWNLGFAINDITIEDGWGKTIATHGVNILSGSLQDATVTYDTTLYLGNANATLTSVTAGDGTVFTPVGSGAPDLIVTSACHFFTSGTVTVNDDLTVASGATFRPDSTTLNGGTSTITIASGGTIRFATGSATIDMRIDNSGTFEVGGTANIVFSEGVVNRNTLQLKAGMATFNGIEPGNVINYSDNYGLVNRAEGSLYLSNGARARGIYGILNAGGSVYGLINPDVTSRRFDMFTDFTSAFGVVDIRGSALLSDCKFMLWCVDGYTTYNVTFDTSTLKIAAREVNGVKDVNSIHCGWFNAPGTTNSLVVYTPHGAPSIAFGGSAMGFKVVDSVFGTESFDTITSPWTQTLVNSKELWIWYPPPLWFPPPPPPVSPPPGP